MASSQSSFKARIESALYVCLKDVETNCVNSRLSSSSPSASALLVALEALFLHGVKELSLINRLGSMLRKKRSNVSNNNNNENSVKRAVSTTLPQPNFWLYVLIYAHKSCLRQIEGAKLITSDVGRCRAFIRLALNQGDLVSYCMSMLKDARGPSEHYHRYAFIRDKSRFKAIIDALERSLRNVSFDLVLNSSLLNIWQTPPLELAGHVAESLQADLGVDAITLLDNSRSDEEEENNEETGDNDDFSRFASGIQPLLTSGASNFLSRGLLNEDEALRIILQTASPTASTITTTNNNKARKEAKKDSINSSFKPERKDASKDDRRQSASEDDDSLSVASSSLQDDIYRRSISKEDRSINEEENMAPTLSSSDLVEQIIETIETEREDDSKRMSSTEENKEDELSDDKEYSTTVLLALRKGEESEAVEEIRKVSEENAVVSETEINRVEEKKEDNVFNATTSKKRIAVKSTPCLSGFIESWFPFGSGRYFDTAVDVDKVNRTAGFTLKKDVSIGSLTVAESHHLMSFFDVIAREKGLDSQNYMCYACSKAIGALFGEARVCGYTKHYYCSDCHVDDQAIIPARIVFNWDFSKRSVCRAAKLFLDAMFNEPIIDIKSFNSALIDFAPLLDQVITTRKKLSYMHAYLITCRHQATRMSFEALMESRKYLFEDVNIYAIRDFVDIKNGTLIALMNNAAKMAEVHILNCPRCTGKGFICEVCKDSTPIYPFHLETIGQCQKCFTVFHLDCSMRVRACPRCERIASRDLRWQVTESKMQRSAALMPVLS